MNVFVLVLLLTALFAIIFKNDKKMFIISTAIIHVFFCGFRFDSVHGDLMAYKKSFINTATAGWFSQEIINNGRNTLFYALNKFIAVTTGNNYQVLLFIISLVSIISVSIVIYKYSESPFISYLMWSCFGFYIFSFYAIKQTLAMAFIMLASIGIFEKKPILFYSFCLIAGFIHLPAFVFLPAYELCRARRLRTIVYLYLMMALFVILFRNQVISGISDLYYESGKYEEISSYGIGGKSLMMIALMAVGIFLCNFHYERYRYTLILIATASLVQMFSVYDNVFTRLADYYFQFIILYAPFILKQPYYSDKEVPLLLFNKQSQKLLMAGFIILALMFYYVVDLSPKSAGGMYIIIRNYRLFWQ